MSKHAPVHWDREKGRIFPKGHNTDASLVAKANCDENAEFIVRACNSHAELVEACNGLLAVIHEHYYNYEKEYCCCDEKVRAACEAIRKAEGGLT
jgi:hypothetical protein